MSLRTRHSLPDRYQLLLLAASILYVVVFARLAFDQHLGMRTHRSDLGQIDQAVWNSSRGRFVENTDAGFVATRMTDHVEPILALISPVFYLWDDVRALLLLQVIFVATGAWPLYALTLHKFDQLLTPDEAAQIWHREPLRQLTRPLALAVALAYLLTSQLQSALLTEFHAAPLAAPLLLWAFWAVEARRLWQFALAALLAAAVKEEMALLAAGLGVWALWRFWIGKPLKRDTAPTNAPVTVRRHHLVALAVCALSLAWFYIATFVIVPAHAAELYGVAESGYFARYGALGNSPLDIFKSFFTRPGVVWSIATEPARLAYVRGLLMPFGFLSLLAPEIIVLALPVLLANLLSAYPAQYYGEFHYSAPLVPHVAVSAAYGLARLWRWIGRRTRDTAYAYQHLPAASAGQMALASFLRNSRSTLRPLAALALGIWVMGWALGAYAISGRGPLGGRYDPTPITPHHRLLARFTAQIPAGAAVTATAAVHPHLSHRRYIYQFPLGLDSPVPAEWALLDVTTNTDMAPGDLKRLVGEMLADAWGVVDAADGFLLLRHGAPERNIPTAFFDFTRPDAPIGNGGAQPRPAWSITVAEDWPRWRQTKLAVTMTAADTGDDPTQHMPLFAVVTPGGDRLDPLREPTPPALVWRPLATLAAGDSLTATTLALYLPRVWALAMSPPADFSPAAGWPAATDAPLALTDLFMRDAQGRLQSLAQRRPFVDDLGGLARTVAGGPLTQAQAQFALDAGQWIAVESWLPVTAYAGQPLDVWLQWRGIEAWPAGWVAFVHLRRTGENQAQADGLPRFFVAYDVANWLEHHRSAPDWRQLAAPADAETGERWQVAIGLYDPQSGRRAEVIHEGGNEVVIGEVEMVSPPAPDQTCALIAATCASQPSP